MLGNRRLGCFYSHYVVLHNQTVEKKYIDAVISDRPVYLTERDGHMGFGNSKALQIARITSATPDPPNGPIMKTKDGEPTGELKEAAQDLMFRRIPPRTPEDQYQSLLQHMNEATAAGLTAAQDAWTSLDAIPTCERAAGANSLKLRLRLAPPILANVASPLPKESFRSSRCPPSTAR